MLIYTLRLYLLRVSTSRSNKHLINALLAHLLVRKKSSAMGRGRGGGGTKDHVGAVQTRVSWSALIFWKKKPYASASTAQRLAPAPTVVSIHLFIFISFPVFRFAQRRHARLFPRKEWTGIFFVLDSFSMRYRIVKLIYQLLAPSHRIFSTISWAVAAISEHLEPDVAWFFLHYTLDSLIFRSCPAPGT